MNGNRVGESKTSPRRIQAVMRQTQAMQLRLAGAEYPEIARQLGYNSKVAAYKGVMAGLKRTQQEPADELRKVILGRLNRLLLAVWQPAIAADVKAVTAAMGIIERICRLMGLDAPLKIDMAMIRDEVNRIAEATGLNASEILAEAEAMLAEARK